MARSYGRRSYKRYNKRAFRSYKRFKKTFRKWRTHKRKSKLINSANKRYVKLRYVLNCEPNIKGSLGVGPHRFNATLRVNVNSLNPGPYIYNDLDNVEPTLWGGSHLPLGVSDLQAQFKKYCVVGAKVTFKYNIKNENQNDDYAIGIRSTTEEPFTREVNNMNEILENGKIKYIYEIGTAYPMSKTRKLTKSFSAKKMFGKKNPSIENDLNADLNEPDDNPGHPKSRAYVDIMMLKNGYKTGTDTLFVPIQGLLIVDYIVLCTERKAYGFEEIRIKPDE